MRPTAATLHDVAVPRPTRRRPRATRALLAALVLAAAAAACSGPGETEVRFLDRVRTEFPDVSVTRATDNRLLRLGRAACGPAPMSRPDVEELRQIGIERDQFVALATMLCPAR